VLAANARHVAETAWIRANNAFVASELYLSDEVAVHVKEVLAHLDTLRVHLFDPVVAETADRYMAKHSSMEALRELKDAMRNEMTRGYVNGTV
jgi:hypothetical protein